MGDINRRYCHRASHTLTAGFAVGGLHFRSSSGTHVRGDHSQRSMLNIRAKTNADIMDRSTDCIE